MSDVPLLAVGQVATVEGNILRKDRLGRVCEVAWCPATNYRRSQPAAAVTFRHCSDWRVGKVVAYQGSRRWGLLGAFTVNADHADYLDNDTWFVSPKLRSHEFTPGRWEYAQVLEMSLVNHPANTMTRRVRFAPLDAALAPAGWPLGWSEFWDAAKETALLSRYRSAPATIRIDDLDPVPVPDPGVATVPVKGGEVCPPTTEPATVHRRNASKDVALSVRRFGRTFEGDDARDLIEALSASSATIRAYAREVLALDF